MTSKVVSMLLISVLTGSLFAQPQDAIKSLGGLNQRFSGSKASKPIRPTVNRSLSDDWCGTYPRRLWPLSRVSTTPLVPASHHRGRLKAELVADASGLLVGGVAGVASGVAVFAKVAEKLIKAGEEELSRHGVVNIYGIIGPLYGIALGGITLVAVGATGFFVTRHFVKKTMLKQTPEPKKVALIM